MGISPQLKKKKAATHKLLSLPLNLELHLPHCPGCRGLVSSILQTKKLRLRGVTRPVQPSHSAMPQAPQGLGSGIPPRGALISSRATVTATLTEGSPPRRAWCSENGLPLLWTPVRGEGHSRWGKKGGTKAWLWGNGTLSLPGGGVRGP